MERHISKDEIVLLFSYGATAAEIGYGVAHLVGCPKCRNLAAGVVASLRATKDLVPTGRGRPPERFTDARDAILILIEVENRRSLDSLRAQGWWAGLKTLSPRDQVERVTSVAAIHKRDVFEAILHESRLLCGRDPFAGEHLAMSAHALVDHLPDSEFPARVKNGFRFSAMTVAANCRRLAGDWQGSIAAIYTAESYLTTGKIEPSQKAYFLSVHASLVGDMGQLEDASRLECRAADVYRHAGDFQGLATIKVQAADTLQKVGKPGEAIMMAEDALTILTPDCTRLKMLAMSIITESMIALDRPWEALRSYEETKPLYDEVGGELTHLKAEYLAARLLDAFGDVRESEKLFRSAINGVTDMEIYRLSFIWRLTLFESMFKRSATAKAARLCEESIDLLKKTEGIHAQMSRVWRDLLEALQTQALTEAQLAKMRDYLVRHWTSPAPSTPFAKPN